MVPPGEIDAVVTHLWHGISETLNVLMWVSICVHLCSPHRVYSDYLLCCGICILCTSVTWCILVHSSCKFKLYCCIASRSPSFCCLASHPPYFPHSSCSPWVAHHLPHSSCSSLRVSEVFDCLPWGWMAGLTVSYSSPARPRWIPVTLTSSVTSLPSQLLTSSYVTACWNANHHMCPRSQLVLGQFFSGSCRCSR